MSAESAFAAVPPAEIVGPLLAQAGLNGPFQVCALPGGRNNRVFRVDVAQASFLLKRYFHHPGDSRDRLAAEYAWTEFASRHGITSIPRPMARDPVEHLGLYEFVSGSKLTAADLKVDHVEQAARFACDINRLRHAADAAELPLASEACFSLDEHLAHVERRIQRLHGVAANSDVEERMRLWLEAELLPAWRRVAAGAVERRADAGIVPGRVLAREDCCLSPSDFGFHNALRTPSGRLTFLDFEYAGWDDPAKLVCDFFCQVDVPVPLSYCNVLVAALDAELGGDALLEERVKRLLPVYRVKWCCIVLNEFVPTDGLRRSFASGDRTGEDRTGEDRTGEDRAGEERKLQQFALAERLLTALNECGITA